MPVWGRPENNYGFGSSDIGKNIKERPFTPFTAAAGWQKRRFLREGEGQLSINGNNLNGEDLKTGKKIFINIAPCRVIIGPDCYEGFSDLIEKLY